MKTFMEQFLKFASDKHPRKRYEYADPHVCACGKFAASLGILEDYEMTVGNLSTDDKFYPLERLAAEPPHNYGALAGRIRRHLAY